MTGVLNTRPPELAPELSARLREAGYTPYEAPLVALTLHAPGLEALRARDLSSFTGVLLSSPNLLSALEAAGEKLPAALLAKPWYLISARARAQVEALGARVAFIPHEASAQGFVREIASHRVAGGARLLHLCSSKTRMEPETLASKGIAVENLTLYTPDLPEGAGEAVRAAWRKVDAVLFASGTAVHNLFACAPDEAATLGTASGPMAVAIGLSASDALKSQGVSSRVRQAPTADNAGFIAALNKEFT